MHLLQAVLLQRRVLQWLVPLISLWVAIICGLAFSNTAVAKAEDGEAHTALSAGRSPAGAPIAIPAVNILPDPVEQDAPLPDRQPMQELASGRNMHAFVIDGDPKLPLPPARAAAIPPEKRLYIDGTCQTPMSLMLHSSFGAERMQQLAREILVHGLKTTTYREVTEGLRDGNCPSSNSIIVSLDDFGTDWLRPHFQSMIRPFTKLGLRLVVAVNVHGTQDPDAWTYLRELEALGHEVANHTIDHYNLARLEPNQVNWQIKGAHQIICLNLGRCPETLILPFGIIDGDGYVQDAASGYSYIVGIPDGREFGGNAPYYLGRIAPDNYDQRATVNSLAVTFSNQPSASAELLSHRAISGWGCVAGPSPSVAMPLALCTHSPTQASSLSRTEDVPPAH